MRVATGIGKARKWISTGFTTMTPWRVGRVLAVGAMLAAGAALYFSVSLGEEGGPSANSETTPASQAPAYLGPEDPELAEAPYDELSKNFIGIPYKDSSQNALEIQRLENRINSLLAEAAHNPSANLQQLDREIELLDNQIEMLRLADMQQ